MNTLETASQWLAQGRKIAMATVIETWGSAPQPVGSQLVVDAEGNFEGAVSGGCVEGAVITEAQDMIASGGHKRHGKLAWHAVAKSVCWWRR
jgi:xanthine/CO dehydrogenase XdhC/CoxF family maturation factor